MHLEKLIDKVQVVSFDIFDTLIWCIYRKPTDLFRHLEEAEKQRGFAHARIEAEKQARLHVLKAGKPEVTLDEIYEAIDQKYQNLREKEIALELFACRENKHIRPAYEYARQHKKRIILTSDMYLPQNVIEQILKNAGFVGYEKLFLSSKEQKTKANGTLYDALIQYTGVLPQEILHIGDHAYTDIQMAEEKGLLTYHNTQSLYPDSQMMHSAYFTTLNKYTDQNAALSVLQGIIREKDENQDQAKQEDDWYQFGFNYMGILAYGYVKWLKKQFDQAGIKKAYFMLRDGYIFKKVFETLYPDFEVHEVFGSRRMFLFAGMQSFEDIQMHVTGMNMQGLNYQNFWDRLYIEDKELERQFQQEFPNRNKIIVSKQEIDRLETFLKKHIDKIIDYGEQERKEILSYFKEIQLFDGKAAIVDLGWKCSMLKGICKLCEMEHMSHQLYGYYLGTHACSTQGMDVFTYGIENGMPLKGYPIGDVLKNSYAVSVLELAFSAPHPSILKVKNSGQGYEPVYQKAVKEETQRMEVSSRILAGVMDFVVRFEEINQKYPLKISLNTALSPIEYIANHISQYDKRKLFQISRFIGPGADQTHFPISPNGMVTVGVINPWPGDISAELEVVERIKQAARDIRIGFVVLDDFGCVLDEQQKRTNRYIKPSEVDFVISTHYETHKTVDAFYYHTLWNPPEIPLNLDYYYERVTDNYIMNDDYLIYDSGGMTNHLKSMLYRKPRNLNDASMLTASCPESYILKPNLNHPLMFYCGMNWEKVVHHTDRHEGLFQLLDATKKVRFYGPKEVKAWGGLRPWEGYQCYQGEIPFDGKSILKEVNRCGICLVISSDIHRRAGSATNRVYEACAAGAVIISDENVFMRKWFQDAALFIHYNKNDPKDTFRQIMEKYNWIVKHKEEALVLARRAQKIFRKYFALDKQLYQIVNRHASRFESIIKDLFAKDDTQRVLVTYVVTTIQKKQAFQWLRQVVSNVENQYYRNISLSVACDHTICGDIIRFLAGITARAQVYPMEIFDEKGSQKMTVGECIHRLWELTDGKYLMNAVADEVWFYDHVTTLVRTIEEEHTVAAYSGRLALHSDGLRRVDGFKPITKNTVYHMQWPDWIPTPGQVLFSEKAKNLIPAYMFSCLDGYEHYALLALYKIKKRQKFAFSRRMTYVTKLDRKDKQCQILEVPFQIRFIRDLVHEEMVETLSVASTSKINRREVNEMLAYLPVKHWVKLRLAFKRFLKADLSTKKGKQIEKRYHKILEQFLNM